MKVVSHPANIQKLRAMLKNKTQHSFCGIEFIESPFMEETRPSGKFVLPSGQIVKPEDVKVSTPLIDYGAEDVDWLLYANLISRDMEMVFYTISDDAFAIKYDARPVLSQPVSRYMSF